VRSLAWSPDGRRLATFEDDLILRIADAKAGRIIATFEKFPEQVSSDQHRWRGLTWADDRRLWIVLQHHITELDIETGQFSPMEDFSQGNFVDGLSQSPDGRRLLVHEKYDFTFLRHRGTGADRYVLGHALGGWFARPQTWHPDSRRFVSSQYLFGTFGYDTDRRRRLGLLIPQIEGPTDGNSTPGRHWLCIGPTGHVRGGPFDVDPPASVDFPPTGDTLQSVAALEDLILYVAQEEDGSQRTWTPREFSEKFGWQNDPKQATLLKLDE
jgi:hypothetical protein